jgi:serine/threonine protein kinase
MTELSDAAVRRLRAVANWPEMPDDRYALVEEIGRGGMGTVYLATDEPLGREVAIKVASAAASADTARRLRGEAQILATLEHPGIVPVHEVGTLADGRTFYVMKRVRGRTLLEHLRDVADLGERLRIFERVCEPVAFAHAHGVIHRDLKPDNVMVGAFGEVLVMDWGVAKTVRHEEPLPCGANEEMPSTGDEERRDPVPGRTQPGTVLGTRGYMAPEQAAPGGPVDARTDVYALGAILVTLLTGSPPPEAPGGDLFAGAGHVPKPLRAICARAMAPDPAARYPAVAALAADVARFRSGVPVEAHRESLLDRGVRLARTYRTPLLLVLAYMLMRAVVALITGR